MGFTDKLLKYGLPVIGSLAGSYFGGANPALWSGVGAGAGAAAGQLATGQGTNEALKAGGLGFGAGYLAGPTVKKGIDFGVDKVGFGQKPGEFGYMDYGAPGNIYSSPGTTTPPKSPESFFTNLTENIPDIAKDYGLPLLLNTIGAKSQSNIMGDINAANQQAYQDYLASINPPEEVKATRLAEQESQILGSAPLARRRLSNELASRGIRGEGTAAPLATSNRAEQDALNKAYFDIYGNYNVPNIPPPANFAPGTGDLLGAGASDIGTILLLDRLYGGGRGLTYAPGSSPTLNR